MDDREITLVCNLRATITIPDNLSNEEEVREYLKTYYYNFNEILKNADIEDYEIEEIENCPYEKDEYDDFDDRWHSNEIE